MKNKLLPIVSALFLVIAMTIQSVVSYHREKEDLVNDIENKMEVAQNAFLFEVYDVCDATNEITDFFPDFCADTVNLSVMLETVLKRFPDLYCCYVSFLPEYSPKKDKRYALCAYREPDKPIVAYDYGAVLNYLEREWYNGALVSDDNGFWSQPYIDSDHEDPIFTYSRKVYDKQGKMIGVAGSDLTLEWTKQMLEDVKPFDDAVCLLYNTKGTLIVKSGDEDIEGMIVREKMLSPTNMRLVIGVPKSHVIEEIRGASLLTLAVLLVGIFIAGWLMRRMWRDQREYARVETAKKMMEKELQIASSIQKGILRWESQKELLGTATGAEGKEDVEVQTLLVPVHEVAGDLYDYCRKGDDLFFIIGDVSGKGVPAAMFMSATVNLFRSAVQRLQSPKAIIEEMNGALSEHNPRFMFVTAFIGRIHVPTGHLSYCNAGHLPPLNMEHGTLTISEIPIVPNIPLGYDGKFQFAEQDLTLGHGDTLVLYTDGIIEAYNERKEMMGMEKWKEIIGRAKTSADAPMPIGNLLAGVKAFIGAADQEDDITLLVVNC